MDNLDILHSFFIASTGLFSIVFSLIHYLSSKREKGSIFFHGMLIIYGICILADTYYRSGTVDLIPGLLYVNYPLLYLLGAFLYYYFEHLLNNNFKLSKIRLIFIVPFIVVLFLFIPYYIRPISFKVSSFPLDHYAGNYLRRVTIISRYSTFPWLVFCCAFPFRHSYLWIKNSKLSKYAIKFLVLLISVNVLFGFSHFLHYVYQIDIYSFILTLSVFSSYILAYFSLKYPDFFLLIQKESSKNRYNLSRVKSLNVDSLLVRIDDLINLEKVHLDPDLSLNSFAEALKIAPHQLSEIINSRFNKNFNTFINFYRIEEVKELIKSGTKDNLLTVSLRCGFNSKSTFNQTFAKEVGMSPSQYKKSLKTNP